MILLAIDTSTSSGVGAIYTDGEIIGPLGTNIHTTHSEGLMPMVDQLFQQSEIKPTDLTGVACVNGPGSYTGLRIGLATAQGFASVNQIPCVSVSSLELLARCGLQLNNETSPNHLENTDKMPVCSVLTARRGWVYAQFFEEKNDKISPLTDELNLQIEDLIAKITQPTLCVGSGVAPYREMLTSVLQNDYQEFQPDVTLRGNILIHMAIEKLNVGETLLPAQLLPHYLGPSQAEINWKKRHPQDS